MIANDVIPVSTPALDGSIAWEEMPTFAGLVRRRHVPTASYCLANDLLAEARERLRGRPPARPARVDSLSWASDPWPASGPLADTQIGGLAAREIVEPEVFSQFFGR